MSAEADDRPADQPLPFSLLLGQLLDAHKGDRLTLSDVSAHLRDRAWGGLLLVFAAINLLPLPPGATTVTAAPLSGAGDAGSGAEAADQAADPHRGRRRGQPARMRRHDRVLRSMSRTAESEARPNSP
jgi:hypothetical protein